MPKKKIDRTAWKFIFAIFVFLLITIGLTWLLMPYIDKLSDYDYQVKLKEWISGLGASGWLIVLAIQIIQIIVAVIPGGPVEIFAGMLYGPFHGLFLCLLGCVLASAFVFSFVRAFGMPLLYTLFSKERIDKFTFLKDNKRIETVAFILFLLPGMPKDMLTYVAGVSEMKMSRFLWITTFARMPAILSSTMLGATMREGDWHLSIIIFAVTALIGLLGICYKDRIIAYCRKLGRHLRRQG